MKPSEVWRAYAVRYGPNLASRDKARWYQSNSHSPESVEEVEAHLKEVLNDAR